MDDSALRLGFVTSRSAFTERGRLFADAGFARLVHALREGVETLTLAYSAAPRRQPLHDHVLGAETYAVALPWTPSLASGVWRVRAASAAIREVERRAQVVIVQLPFATFPALFHARTPRVYHVCSDIARIARTSPAYAGATRGLAVTAGSITHAAHRYLTSRARTRTVTNGHELYQRLKQPPGSSLVSASLFSREVGSVTRRRPPDAPFRVLFVGYLRPEKNFAVLFRAFTRLIADVPNAELYVVGAEAPLDRGSSRLVLELLKPIRERVTFTGHLAFGPDLFQCYADADVLALPSSSEGTPRVLMEARAFGCPVIASDVGGIPTSISDGHDGLLAPPDDAAAWHRALVAVAKDTELRRALVEHGLATARRHSIEAMAEHLLAEARRAREER